MDRVDTFTPGPETLDHIAALVVAVRPEWDEALVRAILAGHAHHVDGADLAVAAIRGATNASFHWPKAIGWRGPHWDGLSTRPPEVSEAAARCSTCGKREDRCVTERPGRDDDHVFVEAVPVARRWS